MFVEAGKVSLGYGWFVVHFLSVLRHSRAARTAGDERDEAYRYFIKSLKRNPANAPAFTSLGVYYSEYASPPDPTRASKCFQKAFELDAREADAARRLAEGFAEEREWDLVEVVARRTIEGEGGMDAGLKGGEGSVAGRYLPSNAWAWKAVGVVELVRPLRFSPDRSQGC